MIGGGEGGKRSLTEWRNGDGEAMLDWFLPLKSSAVEQNSQIPEDLNSSEFDLAPKLCSRSVTGKEGFLAEEERVPECRAEFTIREKSQREKNQGTTFSAIQRGKNIYIYIYL